MAREVPEYLPSLHAAGDAFASVGYRRQLHDGTGNGAPLFGGIPQKAQAGGSQEHMFLTEVHTGVCGMGSCRAA